jgi:hypothetical protein
MTTNSKLLAFGSWKCGCTMLVDGALESIPRRCPEHDEYLLGTEWTDNPNDVPLGFEQALPTEGRGE